MTEWVTTTKGEACGMLTLHQNQNSFICHGLCNNYHYLHYQKQVKVPHSGFKTLHICLLVHCVTIWCRQLLIILSAESITVPVATVWLQACSHVQYRQCSYLHQ